LKTDEVALVVCVNESSADVRREISLGGRTFEIPVRAGRSRLVLFNRADGTMIVATEGEPIIQQ
jgi:hypothetical protein